MTFSAVLLAGGESRRMGRDKATMLFRGLPLWKNQLALLEQLSTAQIFVSARTDPPWRPRDIEFVGDDQPSRGPLSAIAATLAKSRSDHLLALAIDMPFMSANYLHQLCEFARAGRGVVPVIDDRAEPLAAIYPRAVNVDLAAALSGNDFSLQPIIQSLIGAGKMRSLVVSPADRPLFRNLNEPDDLD
ncbi:MAG TPA: molybdenum cofactor guanylyltransferase [Chthoniobacterales bacterium]|jgi:molybdopterin-guanine dinucleotide biosynthesis protein A|nr:molybdenum cofactor guanylyltransferase [Chthoniobacterales bacterium]